MRYSLSRVLAAGPQAWALAAGVGLLAAGEVRAQQQLPGIVVQGSSIAVSPPKKPVPAVDEAPAPSQAKPAASQSSQPSGGGVPADAGPAPASDGGSAARGGEGAQTPGQLLTNQGTSTTVVTGAELRAQQIRHAADALRSLPGVSVNRTGGNAGVTQVRIRGAEGNHTLVLIDGVEANSATDGEFDFSNLATEDIERIEILRGPQSGLYGSGAVGGVVNIVTRSGRGPLTVTARGETGGLSTKDGAVSVSGGTDKAWGLVSMHTRHSGGFNISATGLEKDSNFISTFMAKGGFALGEHLQFSGMVRRTEKKGDRDGEDYSVPASALVPQIDAPNRFTLLNWIGNVEGKLTLAEGRWVTSARAERNVLTADDLDIGMFGMFYDKYRGETDRLKFASTYRLETSAIPHVRHFITGLVEKTDESFIVFTSDNKEHVRERKSAVGEIKGEYFDHLFLNASVRRDDNDVFQDFTTWRATASLKVPETAFRLHAGIGTGVKLPSLFEQFGRAPVFFTPNPNLRPETSEGWDAGVEVTFLGGRLVLDATHFDSTLENKIRRSGFTTINVIGTSTREGWEYTARVEPLTGLKFGAAYTRLTAREPSGLVELRRPEHSALLDASYAFAGGRGNVTLAARYNGVIVDEALTGGFKNVRVPLDDYWLMSAAAAFKVTPQLEVFGRVENLLDTKYHEIYGFESAGLAAYAGIKLTFEDPSTASWAKYK